MRLPATPEKNNAAPQWYSRTVCGISAMWNCSCSTWKKRQKKNKLWFRSRFCSTYPLNHTVICRVMVHFLFAPAPIFFFCCFLTCSPANRDWFIRYGQQEQSRRSEKYFIFIFCSFLAQCKCEVAKSRIINCEAEMVWRLCQVSEGWA